MTLTIIEGSVPIHYSKGSDEEAKRIGKSIIAYIDWLQSQLNLKVPIVLAVLTKEDWDRVGLSYAYPMTQGVADGMIVVSPEKWVDVPGMQPVANPRKDMEFMVFHEAGHLFQYALHIKTVDSFMHEFFANTLASSYVLAARPDLLEIREGLDRYSKTMPRPRFTSFADIDLLYAQGMSHGNYDWLEKNIVRLTFPFAEGQSVATLVEQFRQAFPDGNRMLTEEVVDKLDRMRPGFRTWAGELAGPSSLPKLTPEACRTNLVKGEKITAIGIINRTSNPVNLTLPSGTRAIAHGSYSVRANMGDQLHLPTGDCVLFGDQPGYLEFK